MNEIFEPILQNLLMFGTILAFFVLINLSEKQQTSFDPEKGKGIAISIYICWIIIYFIIILLTIFSYLSFQLLKELSDQADILSITNPQLFLLGTIIPALLGMLFFIPKIRKWISFLIPIDPTRRVHTLALSVSMLIFIQLFSSLAIGLDVLNQMTEESSLSYTLSSIWSQDILLFLLSMVGVGWLTRRNWKETFQRLGIQKLSFKLILFGLLAGMIFAYLATFLEAFLSQNGVSSGSDVEELTEKLLGPLFTSSFGVLTLGLAAALGEESIFRGALQPRFGILFTSILFTLTHANYGLSISTLIVFLLAICLGLLRKYFNTTLCMLVHATYNISLVFLPMF
jgi:membrane protease YdiL (CAAX protease family)